MQLSPLYVLRYRYPDGWAVRVGGEDSEEQEHFYFAEGRCEGEISGTFRAANHPRRRTDGSYLMNMQGFIETDDGALLIVDFQGYGRSYPAGRRQVVGTVRHVTDDPKYSRLNDGIGVLAGEVRVPELDRPLEQHDVELVFDVQELVWESPEP